MVAVNTKNAENTKKMRGRPLGRTHDRPFQMRLNEEFLAKIDNWRRMQPDMPHRSEAIRRLVESALQPGK